MKYVFWTVVAIFAAVGGMIAIATINEHNDQYRMQQATARLGCGGAGGTFIPAKTGLLENQDSYCLR
jgi:hypothetical protein